MNVHCSPQFVCNLYLKIKSFKHIKMKVLILLAVVALAAAFDFPEEWEAWKKEHSKEYKEDLEELARHTIWQANKKFIDSHNAVADKFGYTLRMNQFGDLQSNEIVDIFNGYRMQERSNTSKMFVPDRNLKLAATVDWRDKGYVTEIKNQGQCGSCWAFSTTGSLEGQHFKKTGNLVSLSEQNLVDCSKRYGNNGCKGGLMDNAFRYIEANNGIDTEESYPYRAHDETCNFRASDVGATCAGYVDVPHKDESALTQAVMTVGPISVAIDASRSSFHFYHSGVYYDRECSSTRLDHGVLAVGYGSDNGEDYYIVKNSWGTSWGMDGYIQMSRNKDNNCGIATQASYPKV